MITTGMIMVNKWELHIKLGKKTSLTYHGIRTFAQKEQPDPKESADLRINLVRNSTFARTWQDTAAVEATIAVRHPVCIANILRKWVKYMKGEVPDAVHKPWRNEYRNNRPPRCNEQCRSNYYDRLTNRDRLAYFERLQNQTKRYQDRRSEQPKQDKEDQPQEDISVKRWEVFVIIGDLIDCNDYVQSLKEHKRKAENSVKNPSPDRVNHIRGDLLIVFSMQIQKA